MSEELKKDPIPTEEKNDPETNPAPDAPEDQPKPTDPAEPTMADVLAQLEEIRAQAAKDAKDKLKAENALELERKAHAELKNERRAQLTAEEQLAEREAEIANREADLQRRSNIAMVKAMLSEWSFTDVELGDDDIAAIADSDEEITKARLDWFNTTLRNRTIKAGKDAVTAYIKSTGGPVPGDKPSEAEDYASRYKKAKADGNQRLMIQIKQEAFSKGVVLQF